jgi:hypothetical protein
MPEPTQKTTWTWQVTSPDGTVRGELDGRWFPAARLPSHVSPDGVLTLWLYPKLVRAGERPAPRLVVHGRRFLVDEEPGTLRGHTDEMGATMLNLLDRTPAPPGPQQVTALWFIVDDPCDATPRVFRVRYEEVG